MNQNIKNVIDEIQPLRDELKNHELYQSLKSIEDIKIFMESHVYAVWDFMSLLKALQNLLTCTKVPWTPNIDSRSARLINQIIVDEESDLNYNGSPKSHFEMYLEAMEEIEAWNIFTYYGWSSRIRWKGKNGRTRYFIPRF